MMRPSNRLTRTPRLKWMLLVLTLLLLTLTCCSTSYAEALLNRDTGKVEMEVEDARLLLAKVKALRAENEALRSALQSERADVDALIEQTNKLMVALQEERTAWQEKLAEEKRNSRKNALIMLLVGLAAGGII